MPEPNDSLESQLAAGRARDRKITAQASWKGEKEFKPGSTASQGFLCFGSAKAERPRPKRAACPSLVCEENFARPPPTQHSSHIAAAQQWTQRHRIGTAAGSKSRKAFLDSGEFGARIPAEVLPSHPALYGQRDGESLPAPPPSHLTMAPASIS